MSLTPPGPPSDPQPEQPHVQQPVWQQPGYYPPEAYLRPIHPYAVAVIIVACLYSVLQLVLTIAAYPSGHQLADAVGSGLDPRLELTPFDLLSVLTLPAALAAYVVGCLWLFRARKNVELFRPTAHARSAGWVWGGWVCPIVNLWFPYQVVRDVDVDAGYPRFRKANLGWWWTAWLASLFLYNIASRIASTTSASALEGLGTWMTLSLIANLVALVLWIRLVLRITRQQEEARAARWGQPTL